MTIRQAAAPAIASRSQKASEPKMRTKLPWIGFLLPAALVLIWWLGAEAGYLDATFFSTPQAVVQTLGKLLFSGVLGAIMFPLINVTKSLILLLFGI